MTLIKVVSFRGGVKHPPGYYLLRVGPVPTILSNRKWEFEEFEISRILLTG